MSGRGASSQRLVSVGLLLVACSGCSSTMRKAPDFEERRARIESVAVMPADVEVLEHAFKGSGKRLREDEEIVRLNLVSMAARVLSEQGVDARKANLDEPALKEKPELRFKLTQIQEAFAREMGEAYEKETMRRSKAFQSRHSLGSDVNVFSDRAQVDGLLFVRVKGVRESEGQRKFGLFLDTLIGVTTGAWPDPASGEAAVVQIGLVDGTTGDVLWSDMGTAMNFDGMSMEKTIERLTTGMTPGKRKVNEKKERNQSWKE
jgi:hypothetical protein